MDRIKYAFIMMSDSLTPKDLDVIHDTDGDYSRLLAVNSFEMAGEMAKKLADDGVANLDLCGAFDEEKAKEIADYTGGRLSVQYAKYSPKDDKKMDEMAAIDEYGIIIMDSTIGETKWVYKKHEEFNTTIAFVNSLETSIEAVKKMLAEGVVFVEMCRWYDKEKAAEISQAIDGALPVGYCG